MSLAVDHVMEMLQHAELEPEHWEELARRVKAKADDLSPWPFEDEDTDFQIGAIAEYMVPYFPNGTDGVDIRDYALQAYDSGVRVKL